VPKLKRFLPSGVFYSLIENDDSTGLPIIGTYAHEISMAENIVLQRAWGQLPAGKAELQKKLTDARKVIFNRAEMINWLYKIKEDAKTETDNIFLKAKATFINTDKIDYERIGLMAGIYKEADRMMTIMAATEPQDQNKAHHTIIDRLEELDKQVLQRDEIPGYYQVQHQPKIKKHEFEMNNLDESWAEQLRFADTGKVTENFGNRTYLLNNYHNEFTYRLTQIRPLSKIKDFLDYQLKGFKIGDQIDFLNHIQFRIVPDLDHFVRSDYPVYRQVIDEWLKEKHGDLSATDEYFLINSLVMALESFLEDILENRKRNDENKFNMVIRQALNHRLNERKWSVGDQRLGGLTDSNSQKSRAGVAFRDLIISNDTGRNIMAIECFRLKANPAPGNEKHEIAQHVKKIFRNEPVGISPLGIVIYCETKNFGESWEKYLSYIENLEFQRYHLVEIKKEVSDFGVRSNVKIAKALHSRELNTINVYHLMINLYP
jgi:hypothetical protein